MLTYLLHPTAEKELEHIPFKEQERIVTKLKELTLLNHPLLHPQVIKLQGGKEERFRLRVGDYRVKFTFRKPNLLLLTRVQHRQAGY